MKCKPDKTHQPCPKCGSKDAAVTWADGNGFCHSCNKGFPIIQNFSAEILGDKVEKNLYEKEHKIRPLPEVYHEIPERGISSAVARKFQITAIQDVDSKWSVVYPQFNDGHHIGNKLRHRLKKDFIVEGPTKEWDLFGQHLFPQKSAKTITITEGYDDAMACFQIFGARYPVVSVHSASEAVANCVKSFEYLNSFDTIVINFDKDEGKVSPDGNVRYPGQEAAVACAALFGLGKVKLLTLADAKDANDYLINGWQERYTKEWWNAPLYTPAGLKLGKDMWDEVSTIPKYETVPYPFDAFNKMTYGIRLSEVVLITADTGVGKTKVLSEIEHHILKTTESGVGFLHLEEPNRDTALGLMSIDASKPLHLPDVRADVDNDELRRYFDSVVNNDRVVIWDHFGSNSVHEVLAKIRHMHNLGCKYIFLDHLSIVVSDQSGDERKQLDEISTKLKMICMELNIAVVAVIHINRQGLIRGSAGPEQIANIVLHLARDKENPDEWRRNVTKVTCKKNRFSGMTGPMSWLWYNPATARLTELDTEERGKYEAGSGVPKEEQW